MTFLLARDFFVLFPHEEYQSPCLPVIFLASNCRCCKTQYLQSSTFFESSVRGNARLISDPSVLVKLTATQHSF